MITLSEGFRGIAQGFFLAIGACIGWSLTGLIMDAIGSLADRVGG